jgi:hypothetical protein
MRPTVGFGCLVVVGAASLSLGCASYEGVHGSIRVVSSGEAAGAPVVGARVSLTCPNEGGPVFRVESDTSGRFAYRLDRSVSNACQLLIEKPGFFPRSFRILDVCAAGEAVREDRCRSAVVTAHLAAVQAP